MLSSLIFVTTLVILGVPSAILFIPWTWITGNVMPLYNATQFMVRAGYWLAGIRVETEGVERVPAQTACIFMANHVSNLDPPALIPRIPGRTSAFMKRSLMKIPILGYAFHLGGFIPVDREGNSSDAMRSVAQAKRVLARGLHITTFVEGKRSRDGRMMPFKKGTFYLAMESGAPCIPVSIHGTEKIIPWGSRRIYPGTAHIIFHEPVVPADYPNRDQLAEAVREAIASSLPEWMRG